LKPIVQDLFTSQSQARPDSTKNLDTQREVVVSMLLRVVQYPEVCSGFDLYLFIYIYIIIFADGLNFIFLRGHL